MASRYRCFCISVLAVAFVASCGGEPQIRPQWSVDPTGDRYAPLPQNSKVKLYIRSEPNESYREIGSIMSTCPVEHWEGGQLRKGRPICIDGLRQGARKLGAQGIVDIKSKRYRPDWEPENPWFIMKGVAVRLSP